MSALIHAIPSGPNADNVLLVHCLHISPGQTDGAAVTHAAHWLKPLSLLMCPLIGSIPVVQTEMID